jgi:prepilin-type N-terminal cleavage/methylation domain-containing protein
MRQKGFTLLETVIAMALLATGLVAVLGLLNRSLGLYGTARDLRQDTEMAAELAAAMGLEPEAVREAAQTEALERYPGRSFRLETKPTLHPAVQQVEIQIFRGAAKGEPAYRLLRFVEVEEGP